MVCYINCQLYIIIADIFVLKFFFLNYIIYQTASLSKKGNKNWKLPQLMVFMLYIVILKA